MEYVLLIFIIDMTLNGNLLIRWIKEKVDEGINELKEGRKMKRLKQVDKE